MDISINAKVDCSDGACGEVTRVILNPSTQEITHVVVSNNSSLMETERLLSVDHIIESTPQKVIINLSQDEMEALPVFQQTEFVPSDLTGYTGAPYMMWPYYPSAVPAVVPEKQNIPPDEMSIRRGGNVEASDGHIGKVDEFLVNPVDNRISHLVMREGHLWGKKDVTIPVANIDRFEDNTVYLNLTREEVEKLPTIPRKAKMGKEPEDRDRAR